MYLSKVQIDWTHTRNPYEWHRALWRLFPDRPAEMRTFLFRLEQQRPGQGALILLQSLTAPAPCDGSVRVIAEPKQVDLSVLADGASLRFRLTANAIKTIRDSKDPARPVRVPLLKEEQQLEWLKRKLAGCAEVDTASARLNPPIFFKRKGQAGKLVTTTFDGQLQVRDRLAFRHLVETGVGPAKSFGCGMLSVARTA